MIEHYTSTRAKKLTVLVIAAIHSLLLIQEYGRINEWTKVSWKKFIKESYRRGYGCSDLGDDLRAGHENEA